MIGTIIPRPDPVPTCVRYDGELGQPCPETAVGVDCDGPACAKHMCGEPLCNKRRRYAPAAPAPVEAPDQPVAVSPEPSYLEGSAPPKPIGVVAEARRLLALIGGAGTRDAQVELLALALERASLDGRSEALTATHRVWAETISKVFAATTVTLAREGK